jgi:hypothetical protein
MGGLVYFTSIGLPILLLIAVANAIQKRRITAFNAYRVSLERLKADPINANRREQTLHLGRMYVEVMRGVRGSTTFDEVALKNDIDAACAGAVTVQGRSIEGRLVP